MAKWIAGGADRPLAGIGFLILGVGLLSAMDSVAKWLVGADYPVMQILAVRGWFVLLGLGTWMAATGRIADTLKTRRPGGHLLRVAVGLGAPFFFFSALKVMPQADATVTFFGASTFLMAGISAVVFGERMGWHRWGAIAAGFTGVMIAVRPGAALFGPEVVYPLLAGASYAALVSTTRWLGDSEHPVRLVLYYNLGLTVCGSLSLPFLFIPMPPADIAITALMALLAVSGHLFLTRAFSIAPVGLLAPFEYTALVWATTLGFLIWGDVPGVNVWLGAAVIVAAGVYLIRREALAARRSGGREAAVTVADPLAAIMEVGGDGPPKA